MADLQVIINSQVVKLIPLGFCACGCGQKTTPARKTVKKSNYQKGRPTKYRPGHNNVNQLKGKESRSWKGGKLINYMGYQRIYYPEHHRANNGYVLEHILIAEKSLGKPLPLGAVVHHADGNKLNNSNGNLVICQDNAYHSLLHQRTRAFEGCGNPKWLKCTYCKQYDDPCNLYINDRSKMFYHRICHYNYNQKWQQDRLKCLESRANNMF